MQLGGYSRPSLRCQTSPCTTRSKLPRRRSKRLLTSHRRPLRKTHDLAAQLTNTEWFTSMPGTAEQKRPLIECMSCHTLERVMRSKFDADAFVQGARGAFEIIVAAFAAGDKAKLRPLLSDEVYAPF